LEDDELPLKKTIFQREVLTADQTPDVHYEENWWNIIALSYVQLYLMAPLANRILRPWEVYSLFAYFQK